MREGERGRGGERRRGERGGEEKGEERERRCRREWEGGEGIMERGREDKPQSISATFNYMCPTHTQYRTSHTLSHITHHTHTHTPTHAHTPHTHTRTHTHTHSHTHLTML